jgi:signal transduction histidine kinase
MFRYALFTVLLSFSVIGLAQPAASPPADASRRAVLLASRARQLMNRQQLDSAWHQNLKPGLRLLAVLPASDSAHRVLRHMLGLYYYNRRRSADAIRQWSKVMRLSEAAADTFRLRQIYYNLSVVYANIGLYREAINHSLRDLRLHPLRDNPANLSDIYTMLANNYERLGNGQRTEQYRQLALRYAVLGGTKDPARAYLLRGEQYARQQQHRLAIGQFERFVAIRKRQTNRENVAYCLLNIARCLEKLNQITQARQVTRTAITAAQSNGELGAETEGYGLMARLWQAQGQFRTGLLSARWSVALLRNSQQISLLSEALKTLAEAEEKAGQPQAALQTVRQWQHLTDSLQQVNKVEVVAAIQTTFDVEQKDSQIKLLNQTLTIRQLEQQQQWFVGWIVIGSLLTGVSVTVVFLRRSQRQRAEIEAQARQLAELNRVKDQLFSIVSHDLRGPVASLQIHLEGFDPASPGALPRLRQSVQSLAALIDNVLYWSLSQLGGLWVNRQPVHLGMEVREVIALYQELIRQKNLHVVIRPNDLAVDLPPALADNTQAEIVIRNIVQNAIKFSPDGGQLTFMLDRQANQVSLSVTDEGPGFDWPAPRAGGGPAQLSGTGLGLLVAEDLMHRNAGTLQIDRHPDRPGTVVRLNWPTGPVVRPTTDLRARPARKLAV